MPLVVATLIEDGLHVVVRKSVDCLEHHIGICATWVIDRFHKLVHKTEEIFYRIIERTVRW